MLVESGAQRGASGLEAFPGVALVLDRPGPALILILKKHHLSLAELEAEGLNLSRVMHFVPLAAWRR